MGLNISGLVLDKSYKNNTEELESILGEGLVFEKEVSLKEAAENWKGDQYCDIYFSDEGTLVLLSMERGGFEFFDKKQNTFSFVLSEMTMLFGFNYVEKGNLIRTVLKSEGETMENEGIPLDIETDNEDTAEIIYDLIEETLGESFYDIENHVICYRFTFKELQPEIKEIESIIEATTKEEDKKPWWKVW